MRTSLRHRKEVKEVMALDAKIIAMQEAQEEYEVAADYVQKHETGNGILDLAHTYPQRLHNMRKAEEAYKLAIRRYNSAIRALTLAEPKLKRREEKRISVYKKESPLGQRASRVI